MQIPNTKGSKKRGVGPSSTYMYGKHMSLSCNMDSSLCLFSNRQTAIRLRVQKSMTTLPSVISAV